MLIVAELKFTLFFKKKSCLYYCVCFIPAKIYVQYVFLLLILLKFSKLLQFFVPSTIYVIKSSYTNQHIFYFRATQYYRTYSQTKMLVKFRTLFTAQIATIQKLLLLSCKMAVSPPKGFMGGVILEYITNVQCQYLHQQCCVRNFK